jgi:Rrf2 family protein
MKLTCRSEYALLALIYLSRQKQDGYFSVENYSAGPGNPSQFLEQILLSLKRARYVKSSKGKHGGYALAKPPGKIPLAEIIRLLDGALAPTESVSKYFYETTPIEKEKKMIKLFKEIRDYIAKRLENTSLADMR